MLAIRAWAVAILFLTFLTVSAALLPVPFFQALPDIFVPDRWNTPP